jgi:TPR repeat protein
MPIVLVSIFAVLAGWLYWNAEQQRKMAEEQRAAAQEQKEHAETVLNDATIVFSAVQERMDNETKKRVVGVFQRGAEHGHHASMTNLGASYRYGLGVEDYTMALEWYEKAANAGVPRAMSELGALYDEGEVVPRDYAKAHEWFEKAADKGDTTAMVELGRRYESGDRGVPQDYAKAREWFEKAADKAWSTYASGQGVLLDYAKAREWFEKSADKGNTSAMDELGLLHANGRGVPQDYAKAREWFEMAADKGGTYAMVDLGRRYKDGGRGVPQDYVKAREWFGKAADYGDATAMAALETLSIREAAEAGRYIEALQLQEAWSAKVEAMETEREGKPANETAQALNNVAWLALFAREFTRASTVADRAHALLPDDLMIETNRAHALMFLERGEECKALYLAYKGKPVSERDGRLWEHVIAEDFAELRKAGLTHLMMADIEKELGAPP